MAEKLNCPSTAITAPSTRCPTETRSSGYTDNLERASADAESPVHARCLTSSSFRLQSTPRQEFALTKLSSPPDNEVVTPATATSRRCSVTCRGIFLTWLCLCSIGAIVGRHLVCGISLVDDSEGPPAGCPTMMSLVEYTELICKAGMAAALTRGLFRLCTCNVPVQELSKSHVIAVSPGMLYLCWPGISWVWLGEDCSEFCMGAEALMEHCCCVVVLMCVSTAIFDLACALQGGHWSSARRCCLGTISLSIELEQHLEPGHQEEAIPSGHEHSSCFKVAQALVAWSALLTVVVFYVAATWGGARESAGLDFFFRCLDTSCHAGITVLVVAWLNSWVRTCCCAA